MGAGKEIASLKMEVRKETLSGFNSGDNIHVKIKGLGFFCLA